ncbi:MAG: hypothetical protein AAF221_06870 [Pseudomonadota bacterium]
MKKFFVACAISGMAFIATAPAQAFTSWSKFEYQGFEVKARYLDGSLRHITAVNPSTGQTFSGHVSKSGIAYIKAGSETLQIDIADAEKRFDTRGRQTLAQAQ